MGIINRFFSQPETQTRNLSYQQVWGNDLQIVNTTAGIRVTEETSLNYVAVFACVRLLSESVASLPLDTFRKTNGYPKQLDNPAWLDRPNVEMTRFEFFERVMSSLALWGNAYVLVVRNDLGAIIELWPLDPACVTPERDRITNDIVYRVGSNVLTRTDVMHIKAFSSPSSLAGLSPIAIARTAIGAGIAADQYAAQFWGNGAHPSGVISLPGDADNDDVKQIARAWNQRHQGAANAYKTAVLTGGATYAPISMNAEDSQFLQTRKFQVEEIARLFRIPPHMVGDLEHATFTNIEHQSIDFVVHTLRPWLERIEQNISALLPNKQYVKFNERGLLRGDSQTQAEVLKIAWEHGWLSTDEVRAKLDFEPLGNEIGNQHFVPLNYTTAEQMVNGADTTPDGTPTDHTNPPTDPPQAA